MPSGLSLVLSTFFARFQGVFSARGESRQPRFDAPSRAPFQTIFAPAGKSRFQVRNEE
jgi:hypothetical protein